MLCPRGDVLCPEGRCCVQEGRGRWCVQGRGGVVSRGDGGRVGDRPLVLHTFPPPPPEMNRMSDTRL